MPFSTVLRKKIRKQSDYACCVCRDRVGMDIHHIIPESDGGPSTEDNAAPLCSKCHDLLGPNPGKQRYIRECRDHWFELCSDKDPIVLHRAFKNYFANLNETLEANLKSGFERLEEGLRDSSKVEAATGDKETEWLSFADFIRFVYVVPVFNRKFEDLERENVDTFWDLFLGELTWPDPNNREERDDFIRIFGEETGKRILMWVLSTAGFNPKSFTVQQATEMVLRLEIEMAMFNHHEDLERENRLCFSMKEGALLIGLPKHKTGSVTS